MAKLISDFFCVAESGGTIDNREIKPEWLLEAAKDYNADFYAARLWFEHIRYFGPMGDVFAVKAEKDQATGIVKLYNRIIPSPELLQMKQKGMALYSSLELTRKLERTNGVYQKGLGVTDSPASFSTERLEFTATKLDEGSILTAAFEISDLHFSTERSVFSFFDKKKEQADLNAFNDAFSNDGVDTNKPPNNSQTPLDQEEINMNADDLKALFKDALANFKTELKTELVKEFSDELKEKVTDKVVADIDRKLDEKLEKAFTEKLKPVTDKIDAQDEKFTALGEKQDTIITLAKKPGDDEDNNHFDRDEHGGGDNSEVFTY